MTKGHGRIETRSIWTSVELSGYIDFPYAAQVFSLHRHTTNLEGDLLRSELVHGVTSLSPAKASPKKVLSHNRAHWTIENRIHWVRDVTFDEDRSQVRKNAGPQVMASLRNLAISLLRMAGAQNIAQALRRCAWKIERTMRSLGLVLA